MDKKIEKLLALYKDKSITIEEKRSIAVKLVDMGVLIQTKPNQDESKDAQVRKDFIELIDKYNDLHKEYDKVSKRCDMIMSDNLQNFKRERLMEDKLHKSVIENHKFQRSIANYQLGLGILLVITIISLFI